MNPEEFRERARQNPSHSMVDTLEVSRSLQDISNTLRKKSAECLNVSLKLRRRVNNSPITTDGGTVFYKSTFTSHGNRVELDVQRKTAGTREVQVQDGPPDGLYRIVVDATPISSGRTKVVIYRMVNGGSDVSIRDAITHWVKGDNGGCPELSAL
jgi:hypothetical protein